MSVSSLFADYSLDTPHLSSNSSLPILKCYKSRLSIVIFTAFSVTNILILLPLSTFILYLGYRRWKQQHSVSTATSSHCDLFTFHLLAMEMITVSGSFFFCVGAHADLPEMMKYSLEIFSTTWCVRIQFHTLTCVEHYLAVVHPVTYLALKNKRGVRIRNISIGCVWMLCVVRMSLVALTDDMVAKTLYFGSVAFSLMVVCFCSLSVVCALRRPGPGEVGGERVDQMKRRAFHTIVTITGVLFLCLGGMLVCNALEVSPLLSKSVGCAVMTSAVWFSLPSSLVLPLLFLNRKGKLPGSKH